MNERVHKQLKAYLEYFNDMGVRAVSVPPTARQVDARQSADHSESVDTPEENGSTDPMSKEQRLEKLFASQVKGCTKCPLHEGRTNEVFGVGNPDADIMFVGEGPGRDEDLQGEPFVGRAGKKLDEIIKAIGLDRSKVYIANIVKCRPPHNRNPEPVEVESCMPYLKEQIRIIEPKVICCLGAVATHNLLGVDTPISRLRGHFHDFMGIPVMPTFHPAYLLRNYTPETRRKVWEDVQQVAARAKA